MSYEHPVYTPESVAAAPGVAEPQHRARLPSPGPTSGWGFHEDGCRSGVDAAESSALRGSAPQLPALVVGHGQPLRRLPVRHRFRYRTYQWLVDLDRPADGGAVSAADHLGEGPSPEGERRHLHRCARCPARPGRPGRDAGERAQPRLRLRPAERASGVSPRPAGCGASLPRSTTRTANVTRNWLGPDRAGRFTLGKEFYVSPFFEVAGRYDVTLRLDPERVAVAIDLIQHDQPGLLRRLHRDDPAGAVDAPAGCGAAHTVPAAIGSAALIRLHGVWLWLRRLPVDRAPPARTTGGMSDEHPATRRVDRLRRPSPVGRYSPVRAPPRRDRSCAGSVRDLPVVVLLAGRPAAWRGSVPGAPVMEIVVGQLLRPARRRRQDRLRRGLHGRRLADRSRAPTSPTC